MSKIIGILNLYDSPKLGALTEKRTLASTSFLGRFAIMDFALSNFTNSGIDEISILVKDNFRSVAKHVGSLKSWVNNTKISRQNILINESGIKNPKINTDIRALANNDWVFYEARADYVVIQPAHVISTIDLKDVVEKHIESGADVTVVYKSVEDADENFLQSSVFKIKDSHIVSVKKNNGNAKKADVSLETYVFSHSLLHNILHDPDLASQISLKKVLVQLLKDKEAKVFGYKYEGYARCFDSLQHFVKYSFELLDNKEVADQLFRSDWPIYTLSHNTKPTLYSESAVVKNSYIANGSVIEGRVENSIISRNVCVAKGAVVKNSIILTSSYIDANAVVENAVVDKYAHFAPRSRVVASEGDPIYIEQGTLVK